MLVVIVVEPHTMVQKGERERSAGIRGLLVDLSGGWVEEWEVARGKGEERGVSTIGGGGAFGALPRAPNPS